MTTEEKVKTDEFLENLVNNSEDFDKFVSKLQKELEKQEGQLLTIPRIESTIKKVYASFSILPPEIDLIQLEFQETVERNVTSMDTETLSKHMRSLIAQHRMELYARYCASQF